jgi:hypothetical protein
VKPPQASPPEPPRQETIEEIVARVKQRLAQKKSGPPAKPATPPPAPPPRVKLVWRASVLWPSELTGEPATAEPSSGRVTLSWEPPSR